VRRLAWTFFLIAAAAFGQLDRGSITGVVTDPTGALVPSARIIIQNTATGAKYETVSNAAGQYTMPNLPAGIYQLTFEAPGFKKLVRAGVELGITSVLRVDAALSLGEVSESVEVTAEITRLQTETPETGTSLSNKQLIDLPLSFGGGDGRQAENFAYKITPGVAGGMWKGYINGSTGFSKETCGAAPAERRTLSSAGGPFRQY